jgi:hypothetical protein
MSLIAFWIPKGSEHTIGLKEFETAWRKGPPLSFQRIDDVLQTTLARLIACVDVFADRERTIKQSVPRSRTRWDREPIKHTLIRCISLAGHVANDGPIILAEMLTPCRVRLVGWWWWWVRSPTNLRKASQWKVFRFHFLGIVIKYVAFRFVQNKYIYIYIYIHSMYIYIYIYNYII